MVSLTGLRLCYLSLGGSADCVASLLLGRDLMHLICGLCETVSFQELTVTVYTTVYKWPVIGYPSEYVRPILSGL